MPEKISFKTVDGIEIIGNLYHGGEERFAIFLHMMPQTKEGWEALATRLQTKHQVTGLAIDERGHGESTMGGALNYKVFSDAQQQAKMLDVEAAFEYLKTLGAREESTIIIGGSIGANLAIQFLSSHKNMTRAVALSPGLDYHGVLTQPAVRQLSGSQKVLIVASDDDPESYDGSKVLKAANPDHVDLIELLGAGHAERMFNRQADLMGRIIAWLSAV